MVYNYAWNSFTGEELENALNELGAVGWRVVHMGWDELSERYLVLVEQTISQPPRSS
jgi:acetate kinase